MTFYYMPTFWKFVSEKGGEFTFNNEREMNRVLMGLVDVKKGTVYHYVDGLLEDEYQIEMFSKVAGRWNHMEVVL